MGGAMLAGWIESRFIDQGIYIVEPNEEATRQFEKIPKEFARFDLHRVLCAGIVLTVIVVVPSTYNLCSLS